MKVRIAFVTKPGTRNLDTERIGAIEDLPDDEARQLIKDFIAVEATEQDIADFEARQAAEQVRVDAETPPPAAAKVRRGTVPPQSADIADAAGEDPQQ